MKLLLCYEEKSLSPIFAQLGLMAGLLGTLAYATVHGGHDLTMISARVPWNNIY